MCWCCANITLSRFADCLLIAGSTLRNSGLFFPFGFCGRVTSGRVVQDCETMLGLKTNPEKSRVVQQSYSIDALLCLSTICDVIPNVMPCICVTLFYTNINDNDNDDCHIANN